MPTAPNAFWALEQGTESARDMETSQGMEICLGNVAWDKRRKTFHLKRCQIIACRGHSRVSVQLCLEGMVSTQRGRLRAPPTLLFHRT